MSALLGADLIQPVSGAPDAVTTLLAAALRRLHALDIGSCPFDHRLEQKLVAAAANVAAGRVDEDDFDAARQGWTAREILDWLMANRPDERADELVVAHGDASLPNWIACDGAFIARCEKVGTGFSHLAMTKDLERRCAHAAQWV